LYTNLGAEWEELWIKKAERGVPEKKISKFGAQKEKGGGQVARRERMLGGHPKKCCERGETEKVSAAWNKLMGGGGRKKKGKVGNKTSRFGAGADL